MKRQPSYERQWFEQVARTAQRWGHDVERFFDTVADRLSKGQDDYSDRWVTRPILDFVHEAAEEGADIPGWLVLGAQRLNEAVAAELIDPERAMDIQDRFLRAAAHGLLANEELAEAEKELRIAEAEHRWRLRVEENPPMPR